MATDEREQMTTVPSALHEAEYGADEQAIIERVIGAPQPEQDAGGETAKSNAHVVVDVEASHGGVRLLGAPVGKTLGVGLRQIFQGLQRQNGGGERGRVQSTEPTH